MLSQEITIKNAMGLHTRPGNEFVKLAKQFSCSITLTKNGNINDGKSLLRLMKADISQGNVITLSCDGPDEAAAMDALKKYIASLQD